MGHAAEKRFPRRAGVEYAPEEKLLRIPDHQRPGARDGNFGIHTLSHFEAAGSE